MATCALCQRSGFLLSIDQNELCENCTGLFGNNYDLLNSFRRYLVFCRQSKDILGHMLTKFQITRNLNEILEKKELRSRWERIVKCDLDEYFSYLTKRGYIQKANAVEILEKELSDSEMKSILQDIGQSPEGNKFDMAKHILCHLPHFMDAYQNQNYYVCSHDGMALAEFYRSNQKNWNFETAKVIFFLISREAFLPAFQVMVNHALSQIELPENDMNWRKFDPQEKTSMMKLIYQRDLSRYGLNEADEILSRNFSAFSLIFRDETFEDTIIGPDTSLNKNFFRSVTDTLSNCEMQYEIQKIMSIRKHVKYIQIEPAKDDYVCPACMAAAERQYSFDSLPVIPISECTSEIGCRCKIRAIV